MRALAVVFALATTNAVASIEIRGTIGYSISPAQGQVTITVDELLNTAANRVTGTVHLYMVATASPDPFSPGFTLAEINFANYANDAGRLQPNAAFVNIQITVPFVTPPDGQYYIHYIVAEFPNLNTALDTRTFTDQLTVGDPNPPPPSGDDHGDTAQQATAIGPNDFSVGVLEVAGDTDMFRVDLSQSGTLVVSTSGSTDTVGTLYSASGVVLAENDDSGTDLNFEISASVPPGSYYIAVTGFNGVATGNYGIDMAFTADTAAPTPPPPTTNPPTIPSADSGGGGALGPTELLVGLIGFLLAWRGQRP